MCVSCDRVSRRAEGNIESTYVDGLLMTDSLALIRGEVVEGILEGVEVITMVIKHFLKGENNALYKSHMSLL